MNREKVVVSIKKIAENYVNEASLLNNISEETDLVNELKLGFFDSIGLIFDIEAHYNIRIEETVLQKMLIVKDIVDNVIR